jgi:hypothetical protein
MLRKEGIAVFMRIVNKIECASNQNVEFMNINLDYVWI